MITAPEALRALASQLDDATIARIMRALPDAVLAAMARSAPPTLVPEVAPRAARRETYKMVARTGARRDDCTRYSECLRAAVSLSVASCPKRCAGYEPIPDAYHVAEASIVRETR